VVSNLLIHRAYTDRFPAKLIIQRDQVYTENWNHPKGWGPINPANFVPYSKNPNIARFFREIGYADELGSGVRKIFRDSPVYTPGAIPQLIEGDVFKQIIPIKSYELVFGRTQEVRHPETENSLRNNFGLKFGLKFGLTLGATAEKILAQIRQDETLSAAAIAENIGVSSRTVENQLSKLKALGVIIRNGSKKTGHWKINTD
jgi:ATP-dependent DNA helicase RecG